MYPSNIPSTIMFNTQVIVLLVLSYDSQSGMVNQTTRDTR
jgi:hypothetical protein